MVDVIIKEIKSLASPEDKKALMWFFKTKEGEYGYGDKFLGVKVPPLRAIAKKYQKEISLADIEKLLQNEYHEVREIALFMLIAKYKQDPKAVYELYLRNLDYVNNWDLVDQSAPHILGRYLFENNLDRNILITLSDANELWRERIAILATQYFIKNNDFETTLLIADKYLNHEHDLIRKATGWMLREVGHKDESVLLSFLDNNITKLSSVTFSYAIEKLTVDQKNHYKELRKKLI